MNTRILQSIAALALLASGAQPVNGSQENDADAPESLSPTTEQRFTTRLASRFLSSYHYAAEELDDALSERIFEQYLERLDPNKMYFLQRDIDQLDRYRHRLDDALRAAEIEPAFEIFSIYRKRLQQRIEHARQRWQPISILRLKRNTSLIDPTANGPIPPRRSTKSGASASRTTGSA